MATADLGGKIIVWRTGTWQQVRVLSHGAEVYAVAYSPDGAQVASTGGDNRVVVWRITDGQIEQSLRYPDRALAIAFASNGDLLVGGAEGELRVVNPSTGVAARTIATETSIWSIALSPDESIVATSGPLRLWNLTTGARVPGPAAYGLMGVAFSADGKLLLTGEPTGGAGIWTVESSAHRDTLRLWEKKPMPGRAGVEQIQVNMPAASVALSRNGDHAAVGGSDRVVHLWPLSSAKAEEANRKRLLGHEGSVTAVAFSPDGAWLVSGSLDRTIRVWGLR